VLIAEDLVPVEHGGRARVGGVEGEISISTASHLRVGGRRKEKEGEVGRGGEMVGGEKVRKRLERQ